MPVSNTDIQNTSIRTFKKKNPARVPRACVMRAAAVARGRAQLFQKT